MGGVGVNSLSDAVEAIGPEDSRRREEPQNLKCGNREPADWPTKSITMGQGGGGS